MSAICEKKKYQQNFKTVYIKFKQNYTSIFELNSEYFYLDLHKLINLFTQFTNVVTLKGK